MIVENTKEETRVVEYTIYTCSDGKTFTYKDDAEDYEKYLNAKKIVENLKCRADNFVGFEKDYDVAYYCSSNEEFDAVCIVIRYENVNLRYVDADLYLAYDSETYGDEGWYYFKTKEDYYDDYDYNWRIFICSLNSKRNDIQKQFDKAKKDLDAFNEKHAQYIDDLCEVTLDTQHEQEIQTEAIRKFVEWLEDNDYLLETEYSYGERTINFRTAKSIIEEYEKSQK